MLPGANREIPGIRLEGVRQRDGTPGKSCGTDRRPFPGAPSDTSEGPGRPRDGTPGCVCLDTTPSSDRFGTERQAKPAGRIKGDFRAHLRIQVRAPAGRPRDGTPGKTCGTDQRRLPGAPSDTSEGPGRPRGRKVGIPTLLGRPKTCSRLHAISLTQATGSPLLLAPAGAAPSPEHRLVGHKQQEPTCCPRGVRPCGSGAHRS